MINPLFHGSLSVLASVAISILMKWLYDCNNLPATQLVIGIISAQENFIQRETLRETWLSLANELGITYYFVIGENYCGIPPEYRLSYLSCDEWKPNLKGFSGETVLSPTRTKVGESRSKAFNGFTFILNHAIIVNKIGIDSSIINNSNQPVRVIFENAITNKKIATSSFIQDERDNELEGVIWKKIKPVYLHLGFEGTIYASSDCISSMGAIDLKTELHDETNIILFLQNLDNYDFHGYQEGSTTMVTFSYSISDFQALQRKLLERERKYSLWSAYIKDIRLKVFEEKNKYNDIVQVNVVDVYRNLPKKMMEFYKWINTNVKFKYLLKTDDDVFVNLPSVIRELEKGGNWRWWSCFRVGWPVRRAGKWRETILNITEYPPFPSGAGYVVHSSVVDHLVENYKDLYMNAQGEDVSIGIWLEQLNLVRLDRSVECNWACTEMCEQNNCNMMELSSNEMLSAWQKYKNCDKKFCWC